MTIIDAQSCLAPQLKVQQTQLCIVPVDNTEVLCYEIKVSNDGEEFLVYINASTGEEVDLLKIIKDKMGYTVM